MYQSPILYLEKPLGLTQANPHWKETLKKGDWVIVENKIKVETEDESVIDYYFYNLNQVLRVNPEKGYIVIGKEKTNFNHVIYYDGSIEPVKTYPLDGRNVLKFKTYDEQNHQMEQHSQYFTLVCDAMDKMTVQELHTLTASLQGVDAANAVKAKSFRQFDKIRKGKGKNG